MQRKLGQNLSDAHVLDREARNGQQKEKRQKNHYFAQAHSRKVGLKKFWKKGKDGEHKEVK